MERLWEKTVWPVVDPMIPEFPGRPIFEEIRLQARLRPDKVAIVFYGYEITFRELDDLSDRFAAALKGLGVQKGDRVGIYLENCPQFVIAFYGILKMGGVAAPCSPMYKSCELEYELRDAGIGTLVLEDTFYSVLNAVDPGVMPENVITTSFADYLPELPAYPIPPTMETQKRKIPGTMDFKALVEQAAPDILDVEIDLDRDLAVLQYTAGTTGNPKGAMLTHGNLAIHGKIVRHYYEYEEDDVHLLVLPVFHVTGLDIAMNPALAQGSTLVMFARFDPMAILDVIPMYRVTHWVTIAPVNIAVTSIPGIETRDFSSLRLVLSGGAPVPVEIHERWRRLIKTSIVEGYGLSEATGGICGNNCQRYTPCTIGAPVYFHDIRIVDPAGNDLGINQTGELWIKGPCVMKGYWNDPDKTRETITPDGWLKTGDMAILNQEGWLSIVGRKKEMIKVSGYSVFLAEIDAFLLRHDAVAEAVTIGIPHERKGETPKSFI
ncbi:MAG: long-chain fatty acid--CoA ligase [Desulfobacteraceae bacterium]|nr:long-chain fatty acid--CoA ligase [Desulfobacteraceae bacterium]